MKTKTYGREYGITLAAIVFGGSIAIFGLNRTWQEAPTLELSDAFGASMVEALSGAQLITGAAASAWASLLCALAVLATRRFGRILAGLVLVFAGGFLALESVRSGSGGPVGTTTMWWVVVAIAGLIVVACGVLAILRGGLWPTLSRRYERGAKPVQEESAWDALDAGRDPTIASD